MQGKLREKMTTSAITTMLAPFTDLPEDFIEWRDNAVHTFAAAGRAEVLQPDFRRWAQEEGWSDQEIWETDRWASVIIKSPLTGCEVALDAFQQAPPGQGSLGFCFLRRHFEILGQHVSDALRLKIENFSTEVGEDPTAMIRRLNKLYLRYSRCPNPEPQSRESKIRRLLLNASQYETLNIKVKMLRSMMTSGMMQINDNTYELISTELISEWLSFGMETQVNINKTKINPLSGGGLETWSQ
jgi:hypothetical protein